MRPTTYHEYAEVRLNTSAKVDADGRITIVVVVASHGNAKRVTTGRLDNKADRPGLADLWVVYDENDQHTGIIEKTKTAAIQAYARRSMAQLAGWTISDASFLKGFQS